MGGKSISNGITTVVIILLLTLAPGIVGADSGNTVAGNTVKWSSAQGDLVVWPHTANALGTQTQYANLTWKLPSTNLDVAFKFPIPITGKIYLWRNISHSVIVYDYGSQTVCSTAKDNTTSQNITVCRNQTGVTGSHMELVYYYDWDDISGALTHTVINGSHYYWVTGVTFTQGETKQVKWQYAVPINSAGKWSLLVKRSQDTLESALTNNLFVELDPWWGNSSWAFKKNITIVNNNASAALPSNYTVNLTFDHSSLVSANQSLTSGDDVRVVYNGATELDRINVTAFNTGTTVIVFRTQADIQAGGNASNYELYYGNPSASAPPADPNNVYLFWDDFNSYNNNISHPDFVARWSRWWWNAQCTPLIHDNLLSLDCSEGPIRSDGYMTTSNFPSDIVVEFDYTSAGTHYVPLYYFRINTSTSSSCQWTSNKLLEHRITYAPPGDSLSHVNDAYSDSSSCTERGNYSFLPTTNQTYAIKEVLFGSNWNIFIDDVLKLNGSVLWTGDGRFGLRSYSDHNGGVHMHTDNIRIRKYLSPEPNAALDTTPPTTNNAPKGWQNAPFNVTLTCTDDLSGCSFTTYRVDGGAWTNGTIISITTDGNHTLEYYSVDVAGNAEATKTDYAALDTTPPTITIQSPANATYQATYFDLNFTAVDALSGVAWTGYSLDGGPNVTSGNATIYGNTNGSHRITVYANDTASDLASSTVYFALSPLVIFLNLTTDKPSYARGNRVTITANVSNHDNVSHNDFNVNFLVRDPNMVLVHNDTVQVQNINPGQTKAIFTKYVIASNATLGTYTVDAKLIDPVKTYDIKRITFQVA